MIGSGWRRRLSSWRMGWRWRYPRYPPFQSRTGLKPNLFEAFHIQLATRGLEGCLHRFLLHPFPPSLHLQAALSFFSGQLDLAPAIRVRHPPTRIQLASRGPSFRADPRRVREKTTVRQVAHALAGLLRRAKWAGHQQQQQQSRKLCSLTRGLTGSNGRRRPRAQTASNSNSKVERHPEARRDRILTSLRGA